MMSAIVILGRSLNTGINAATIQFNTIHKTRLAMSNYERMTASEMWHAALPGYKGGDRLGFASTSMYSFLCDYFIVGCHVRM
jgi:hypothetical protein